jgi:hypothetical protein
LKVGGIIIRPCRLCPADIADGKKGGLIPSKSVNAYYVNLNLNLRPFGGSLKRQRLKSMPE